MPVRPSGGGGWKPSQRQLDRIAKLRGQEPPLAWNKIVVEMDLPVSGERLRQVCKDAGMTTTDGRTQHLGNAIPWKTVLAHHRSEAVYRMLKRYSYRLQGREMKDTDNAYLDDWLRWMDGANEWGTPLAVHYDRDAGWSIRRRTKDDDGPINRPRQLQAVK